MRLQVRALFAYDRVTAAGRGFGFGLMEYRKLSRERCGSFLTAPYNICELPHLTAFYNLVEDAFKHAVYIECCGHISGTFYFGLNLNREDYGVLRQSLMMPKKAGNNVV